jgi:DNA-binding XRE family transcriptional regulator
MLPLVELVTEHTGWTKDVFTTRITLLLTQRDAAAALGLSLNDYAAVEEGRLHLKDAREWQKARALLIEQARSNSTGKAPGSTQS